jgi:quercetin dioxygenase-like cupin family protein
VLAAAARCTEPDSQQEILRMKVLHIHADSRGESHFDMKEIALTLQEFAPPAAPLYVSEEQRASGYQLIHLPAGWIGAPHPAPYRQMLFCLAGSFNVSSSAGEMRTISAGDAFLIEDTSGKGHSTLVTSSVPVDAVLVRVD